MGAIELPQERRHIPDRRCGCGCEWFVRFYEAGPNIGAYCEQCGTKAHSWIPKAAIGLAKTTRPKRDNIDPFKRSEILARYRHRCAWCGIAAADAQLEIGHIVAHAFMVEQGKKKLADHPVNLAPTCRDCNEAAHKVRREDFDVCMLLVAAVSYMAGGVHADERLGENGDDDSGAIRTPVRGAGLGRIPLPGRGEAPAHREGLAFGNPGRVDDPKPLAR